MSLIHMCEEEKINSRAIELAIKLKADPNSEFQRDFDGNTPLYSVCEPWLNGGKGEVPRTIALVDTLVVSGKAKDEANATETMSEKLGKSEEEAKKEDNHKSHFLKYLQARIASNSGDIAQQDIAQEFQDTPMDYILKQFTSKMDGTKEKIIKRIKVLRPSLRLCAICERLLAAYSCSNCQNPLLCEICAEAINRTKAQVPGCKLTCPLCPPSSDKADLRFEEMIWEPNIDGGA